MGQMMQDLILSAVDRFGHESPVSNFKQITPTAIWRMDLGERVE